mgnify:CR=1 FL=1
MVLGGSGELSRGLHQDRGLLEGLFGGLADLVDFPADAERAALRGVDQAEAAKARLESRRAELAALSLEMEEARRQEAAHA